MSSLYGVSLDNISCPKDDTHILVDLELDESVVEGVLGNYLQELRIRNFL